MPLNAVGDVIMPGDIAEPPQQMCQNKKVVLGPGLRYNQTQDKIVASKPGILRMKPPNTFWVDSYQKRYVPCRGEMVIGIIVQKAGDIFRVDIGAADTACLSYLAFEGATKKNRPDINVGDLVLAKMLIAHKDFESELICVNSLGKKDKLGLLSDGFMFTCSLNLVRKVLNPNGNLFKAIQREIQIPVEIVVGMNGRIWLKARTTRDTITVANAILAAEYLSDDEIGEMCQTLGYYFTGIKY